MKIKRKVTYFLMFGVLLASGSQLQQTRLPSQTVAFEPAATTDADEAMSLPHFKSWPHFH
ncbi:hypothetical protein D3C78_1459320 [compost metagenome]